MSMLQTVKRILRPHKEIQDPVPIVHPDWHWTKDQYILEQFFHQLMFIPDDMMVGGQNHEILQEVSVGIVNPTVYTHNKFLAYQLHVGVDDNGKDIFRPIFMPPEYKPSNFIRSELVTHPGKIRGELHLVWSNKIYLLDKFRQNGVQFARHRVKITYPWRYVQYGKNHPIPKISAHSYNDKIVAHMYVGIPTYWDPLVGGIFAKPMQLVEHEQPRPWVGEFYKFDTK